MDDLDRLKKEYADRTIRMVGSDKYSCFNTPYLFTVQQREREELRLLKHVDSSSLENRQILEIGCGTGGILFKYFAFGASLSRLDGCDLLWERLSDAHIKHPQLSLTCADAQNLPYPPKMFDFVLQYTVFTSILDDGIKHNLASEMLRVLKPDGLILWYDFWLNPTNHQTRGIRPAEIRRLFPNCTYEFHKITLAPPLARRIVPISWILALFLEKLKIFNSHYLVAIRALSG